MTALDDATLEELGISRDEASRFQRIAEIPEDEFEAHIASSKEAGELTTAGTLRKWRQLKSKQERKKQRPLDSLGAKGLKRSTNRSSNPRKSKPYQSRSIKRARRSKADIRELRGCLYKLIEAHRPMTVRQVFYQAVVRGLIEKSESNYKNTIVRLLTQMRTDGDLPFTWIADNTRWMRKPTSYTGLGECLWRMQEYYRRDLWSSQSDYVEIWLEKEALSGVLFDVTAEWDVPLMVTRGYASISFLATAAEAIHSVGKPTHIYYFGDHDPSGVDIPRNVEKRLNEFAGGSDISFHVVAVRPEQIEALDLPTRPTKTSDSRAKSFTGESIEVDAIPPDVLRGLVEECIERHIDHGLMDRTRLLELRERETLEEMATDYEVTR